MNQCSAYVGLDVHKDTIAVAGTRRGRLGDGWRGWRSRSADHRARTGGAEETFAWLSR